jgi:hypothetical protein
MRKRIKVTGFSDWDSMFYNNLLSIPVLLTFSFVIENWGSDNLDRNLYVPTDCRRVVFLTCIPIQPTRYTWPAPLRHRILGRGRGRHLIYYRMVHPRDKQYDVQVRVILNLERWVGS